MITKQDFILGHPFSVAGLNHTLYFDSTTDEIVVDKKIETRLQVEEIDKEFFISSDPTLVTEEPTKIYYADCFLK